MHKAPKGLFLKDEHGEGRNQEGAAQNNGTHFPSELLLSRPGEHPLHHAEDVKARNEVEGLEDDVPCWMALGRVEEVEVARAENGSIEDLGDEGDTLGRAVAVDSEDEDKLGENMGDVAEIAKYLSWTSANLYKAEAGKREDGRSKRRPWLRFGTGRLAMPLPVGWRMIALAAKEDPSGL